MPARPTNVTLEKDEAQCRVFLPEVVRQGDSNKKALGFLPYGAYEAALSSGRLWILIENGIYCGHLVFGGTRPTLCIIQLFVVEQMRGRGLARLLTNSLIAHGESLGFTSIRARVASDLEANAAWERLGFETISVVAGGSTTGRSINKRFRPITPSGAQTHMFAVLDEIISSEALKARGMPINRAPWYTLDLNVWLDFFLRREGFFEEARSLIRDAARGRFRVRFTREAIEEAKRSAAGRESDPLMAAVQTWQTVPEDDSEAIAGLVDKLRALIFPDRSPTGRYAANDNSDLRHIAMSALAGATGFVTREKALLRHQEALLRSFGLAVLSPSDLIERDEPASLPMTTLSDGLKIESIQNQWAPAVLLIKESASRGSRLRLLDREDNGRVCLLSDRPVGILYWGQSHLDDVEAYLVIEVRVDPVARQRIFDILLGALVSEARSAKPFHRVLLRTDLETCEHFRRDLHRFGLFDTREADFFVKFVAGDPVNLVDWSQAKTVVDKELGVDSVWLGHNDSGFILAVRHGGSVRKFDRFSFETFFGMTALTIGGRRSFFVPINERFAMELLPYPWRPGLFREHDASLRAERVYFRDPRYTGGLVAGDVIFFYVSDPISAIVGVARCTASEILGHEEAAERFQRLAVLNPGAVGLKVHCIAFDNYIHFRVRLTRDWIARNHALPGNNFVTLARVPEAMDALDLLAAGASVRDPR